MRAGYKYVYLYVDMAVTRTPEECHYFTFNAAKPPGLVIIFLFFVQLIIWRRVNTVRFVRVNDLLTLIKTVIFNGLL